MESPINRFVLLHCLIIHPIWTLKSFSDISVVECNCMIWTLKWFSEKKPNLILLFDKVRIKSFGIQCISRFIYIKTFCGRRKMLAYMGESIQEWTKQNLWKAAFKSFEGVWSALGRPYPLKFFKDCLPQIWLGSFLNTLYRNTVKHFNFHSFINPSQSIFFFWSRGFLKKSIVDFESLFIQCEPIISKKKLTCMVFFIFICVY